jgi:hypothetical protein
VGVDAGEDALKSRDQRQSVSAGAASGTAT